jgi:dephospho-CoA kinase
MIIGITGKSGSGKSTLSKQISEISGYYHFDIDKVCYLVIEENLKDKTIELFGNVFNENGKLENRIAIGDLIFKNRDDQEYKQYSYKVYLYAVTYIKSFMNNNTYKGYIFDHILLPHEKELFDMCDIKILTKSDNEIRKIRVLNRDKIKEEYFILRESASIEYNERDFNYIVYTE